MRGPRVSFSPALQQLSLGLIAFLSCALSFWLTVRFCSELAPDQTPYELLAIGTIWELSKLTFGTIGMHTFGVGSWPKRARALLLLVVSGFLAGGSVTSSLGFLVQTTRHSEQRVFASSTAYQRQQADLTAIDSEMKSLQAASSLDISQNFRARGLRTLARLTQLRTERQHLTAALAEQELHPAAGTSLFFQNIGTLLPGHAQKNADRLRLGAQCMLALMLEVVSLLALALLRTPFQTERPTRSDSTDGASPLHLVRTPLNAPSACIENDAVPRFSTEYARTKSDAGRGDTSTADPGKSHRYRRAKEMIASARLRPSYRALQRTLEISQPTAQRFLRDMVNEGFLTKSGRAYRVVTAS